MAFPGRCGRDPASLNSRARPGPGGARTRSNQAMGSQGAYYRGSHGGRHLTSSAAGRVAGAAEGHYESVRFLSALCRHAVQTAKHADLSQCAEGKVPVCRVWFALETVWFIAAAVPLKGLAAVTRRMQAGAPLSS